jgi:SAM-dependent methyltransferase
VVEPAGDVDYSRYGVGYAGRRQTDPRIAARLHQALGPARSVLNVGAGAGSYEPTDRTVVAIEPSEAMLSQRGSHLSPAIRAVADALPLADGMFDAAMTTVSVHQWPDARAGLDEMRRVTLGPVVLLTFDPAALDRLWLADYCPALYEVESARYPDIDELVSAMGPDTVVTPVPVPLDCRDGFTEAFYGRPEAFLQPEVRRSQSAWSFVGPGDEAAAVEHLATDLSGAS